MTSQDWTSRSTLPFPVTAGPHVVEFRTTQDLGDHTAFFDSIQMQAIPEPSAAILVSFVLFGAGIVSLLRRRKAA